MTTPERSADTDHFGPIAHEYDQSSDGMNDPGVIGPTIDFLAGLAGDGPVLELAIGTGRVGLPLSELVPVHGIELSPEMVAELRRKPGGDAIPVTLGDMASAVAPGVFSMAYLVYNTISNLRQQHEQVECFRNVARHLAPGGQFVIELFVPPLRRMPLGQTVVPFHHDGRHTGFDTIDTVTQQAVSHHYYHSDHGIRYGTSPHRYVWPAELDLMAQLAGMELVERWSDWDRSPFIAESASHVSVWRLG